jgi:hypothetical protein
MAMFETKGVFNPALDSKVPLKRSPVALTLRLVILLGEMLFSRHPHDTIAWIRSMLSRRRPLSYAQPWLTFDAMRAIRDRLPLAARVYEFGAGNSTIYWARHATTVASVESDARWLQLLAIKLAACGLRNVKMVAATDKRNYVDSIHEWPDDYFDLVVVDGDFRPDCVIASIRHLKHGGILVVDNTDWHWFRSKPLAGIPETWKKLVYPGYAPMIGHKSETTLFVRNDS